jgi:hypothetical protein
MGVGLHGQSGAVVQSHVVKEFHLENASVINPHHKMEERIVWAQQMTNIDAIYTLCVKVS